MEKELTKALAEYPITPAKVAEMAKEFQDLAVIPEDIKSYKEVHKAKMILIKTRIGVDKRRKELGEDARNWVNAVNQAAKDLLAPITPIEYRFKEELAEEDARIEKIKTDRVDGIKAKIDGIKSMAYSLSQLPMSELESRIQSVKDFEISEDEFQDLTVDAKAAAYNVLVELGLALKDRVKRDEAEAVRIAEEARLDKIREEQKAEREKAEAKQKELDEKQAKLNADLQEIALAKAALEAEKKAAEDKKNRETFEKQAKEEARIQAEKDAKEKAERDEKTRLTKEAADKAEKARLESLQPDRDKLEAWANEILDMRPPKLESIAAKKIADNMLTTIFQAVNGLLAQSKNL